ncbi:WD40 repeat domain-containing protein [Leptolyngbya cf. ectocarpi LEGE 11479]|uniref:WD40 repeat domain-containing protein n=1 Tax=Leptolyngbya cf. ectocarpi LEGE 11479 TaxID=1828722 RepID=A0A928ZPY0_LEPEC|nr:WD40 repeat domain-containing protein [Leptolyngbya ectocarpi]MBE9065680.1 WD40 repeat domain-containing protein [Leptolyngbya cf. ectocarpi LEGE 11479]
MQLSKSFANSAFKLWVFAGLTLAALPTVGMPVALAQATGIPVQLAQASNTLTLLRNVQHGRNVNAIAFSPNAQMFASAGGDGMIRVWDVDATLRGDEKHWMRRLIQIPGADRYVTSLVFSPDNRYLVTGTYNGNVRVWDLNACERDRPVCNSQLILDRDYVGVAPKVQFSPSGRWLAATNYDGTVTLWDWASRRIISVLEPETGSHDGSRPDGRFSSLTFSPDEAYLAAGSHDDFITLWSLDPDDEFERLATIDTGNGVDSVAFSPNGEFLASGNFRGVEIRSIRERRGRLKIEQAAELEVGRRVNTLAFLPNGQSLFVGDNVDHIGLWDLEEEEPLVTVPANQQHSRPVLSVALSPSGNLLASGSSDGVIKFWRP